MMDMIITVAIILIVMKVVGLTAIGWWAVAFIPILAGAAYWLSFQVSDGIDTIYHRVMS
jgi:hypothetical protein